MTLSIIFIVFQPEDDDIKAHWDKLVVSAKSFPCLYWDKFIKKRVSHTKVFMPSHPDIRCVKSMQTSLSLIRSAGSLGWRSLPWCPRTKNRAG